MSRCLQIAKAYAFKLTRRHSTLLWIAIFLLTLFTILELYQSRGDPGSGAPLHVGNYDYRPGNFLKGHQPENASYCIFNYGLPDKLDWNTVKPQGTPQMNTKYPFRVIYDAMVGTAYANLTKFETVTYATQATPEYLYHIVEIARLWDGPISLAVFVPDYDLDLAMQMMAHLCKCYQPMSKVSLHLYYPLKHLPVIVTRNDTVEDPVDMFINWTREEIDAWKMENVRTFGNKSRHEFITMIREEKASRMANKIFNGDTAAKINFEDCSGYGHEIYTFRKKKRMVYPINIGRNVARKAAWTKYFIVSDIEMVPSEGLAEKFVAMMRDLMGGRKQLEGSIFAKTVFIIPLFEVERGEQLPRDKKTLVRLVAANRAYYFHQKTCAHCQRFPGIQGWLARAPTTELEPMLIAKREYPYHRWEPLYFGTQSEPWYSELLSWEGRQEKMTQMLELCLLQYRFVVVDGGFLCHAAPRPAPHHPRPERDNAHHYSTIVARLRVQHTHPHAAKCKFE